MPKKKKKTTAKKTTAKKTSTKKTSTKKKPAKKTAAKKKAKTSRPRVYCTHDNGGRPFRVVIHDDRVEVFERTRGGAGEAKADFGEMTCMLRAQRVFVPTWSEVIDGETWRADGNSILVLERGPVDEFFYEYVWIGPHIYRFATNEEITEFYSPVLGSDVAYPYAVSATQVHLLAEKLTLSRDLFPGVSDWSTNDPYQWCYRYVSRLDNTYASELVRERLLGPPL